LQSKLGGIAKEHPPSAQSNRLFVDDVTTVKVRVDEYKKEAEEQKATQVEVTREEWHSKVKMQPLEQ